MKSTLSMRLLKVESYSKGIALSSAFNLLAKGLAFGTSLAIAYYFGMRSATDVYFYAIATVTMLATLFSGVNSSVIVPEAMRIDIREGTAASMEFLNFFLFLYLAIATVMTVLIGLNPLQGYLAVSRFSVERLAQHQSLLTATVPLFGLILVSTFLSDILTSRKFFTIPMITSMINSGLVLVCAVWLHNDFDVMSLVIGLLVAYVIQIVLLLILMVRTLQWKFLPLHARISRTVMRHLAYAGGGTIMSVVASYVPILLFSGMTAGVITALSFGQRIADLPTSLITLQFSAVAAIKFNELGAQRDERHLNEVFLRSARILLFILVPIATLVCVFAREIVALLYKRGAFDAHAVESSAMFLRYLILLLPLLALNTLVSRIFMAMQKITIGTWYQVGGNVLLIVCIIVGVRVWGVEGYLVGLLTTYAVSTVAYVLVLRKVFPFLQYGRILRTLAVLAFVNTGLAVPFIVAQPLIVSGGLLPGLLIATGVYGGLLLLANRLWRLNDDVDTWLNTLGHALRRTKR